MSPGKTCGEMDKGWASVRRGISGTGWKSNAPETGLEDASLEAMMAKTELGQWVQEGGLGEGSTGWWSMWVVGCAGVWEARAAGSAGQIGAIAHLLALLAAGGDRWSQAWGWGPWVRDPGGRGHAWPRFPSWATSPAAWATLCFLILHVAGASDLHLL